MDKTQITFPGLALSRIAIRPSEVFHEEFIKVVDEVLIFRFAGDLIDHIAKKEGSGNTEATLKKAREDVSGAVAEGLAHLVHQRAKKLFDENGPEFFHKKAEEMLVGGALK